MKKILVLFAHPRPDRSEVGIHLVEAAKALTDVTVVDLYAEYPTLEIDVDREQQRLLDHDIIIFQFPLYWYSAPSILKEWQDLVLEHGFAYGKEGKELVGKITMNVTTAGAIRHAYTSEGANEHELRELFLPFERTALLCGMRYLGPYAIFGSGRAVEERRVADHVTEYVALLEALMHDRFNLDSAEMAMAVSDNLKQFIEKKGA